MVYRTTTRITKLISNSSELIRLFWRTGLISQTRDEISCINQFTVFMWVVWLLAAAGQAAAELQTTAKQVHVFM